MTGNYLAETTRYVTEFQTGHRMTADGVLDKRTLDALTDLPGDPDGWDLRSDCVSLRRPTGEADGSRGVCVTLLRTRLSQHGIRAGRGDTFDAAAAAAVTAFQTRTGLPPIGVAGPRTRRALYGTVSQGTAPACTSHGCLIVLGRTDTRDLAASYPENKFVRNLLAEAISAAACSQVRARAATGLVCQTTTSYIIDSVSQALDTAAARHACLRVRVGYPPGQKEWSPLGVEPYKPEACRPAQCAFACRNRPSGLPISVRGSAAMRSPPLEGRSVSAGARSCCCAPRRAQPCRRRCLHLREEGR